MNRRIKNWAGNIEFEPERFESPGSVAEIREIIRTAREKNLSIRVAGSRHSWTRLIETPHVLVSLDRFSGIESVNVENRTARIRAGTRLRHLGKLLDQTNLAMENLGDIDHQTLAGALSTGTHGTGIGLGALPSQVGELHFLNGLGEPVSCSRTEHPDLFRAALVSLGALGVLTHITLKLLPAYNLHVKISPANLEVVLANLPDLLSTHRHVEFFWFPYTDRVLLKRSDQTDDVPFGNGFGRWMGDLILENAAFGAVCRYVRAFPSQAPAAARFCGALLSKREFIAPAHTAFATPRLVKLNEMEYGLPEEAFEPALREIRSNLDRKKFPVHFPIECRWVRRDDSFIGPASDRPTAFIAIHQYQGMPFGDYFAAVEQIFQHYDGRPHWGKIHTRNANYLREKYSHWNQFLALRDDMDPQGLFLNGYLRTLFGYRDSKDARIIHFK